MKTIWFHMQGYRDLPDDFSSRYESVWVDPPNDELCDPEMVGKYIRWNLEELEFADDAGFDGIGTNEHHQNAYGFPVSPHLTGNILARRESDAAIVLLGTTLPNYHPLRVAEELATIDCLSGGRLAAGWPVGSAMDTTGCYGIVPDEVRPRYYEAHDFIKRAWTQPGPFPFNGKYTKLRYANPWPKPIQKPHPPIWLAGGGSLETYHFAAQNSYTYSYLSFLGAKAASRMMTEFWDTVESYGLDDNPYRAGFAQAVMVADTDAEARRLYEKHVINFYDKSLHTARHFAVVPGYMTQASFANLLKKSASMSPFETQTNGEPKWDEIVEENEAVIAGSPDTVAEKLIDMVKRLRIGHLIAIMQLQSMHPDETKLNTSLFAEHVLPRLRKVWEDEGYVDHWWPAGATRGASAAVSPATGGRL